MIRGVVWAMAATLWVVSLWCAASALRGVVAP